MSLGGNGACNENELPSDMIPAFDYGSINDNHKQAASEIARLLAEGGNETLSELIKFKFNVIEPKKTAPAESVFVQICQDNNIHVTVQGYVFNGVGSDAVQFPIIAISEDVRVLDQLVAFIRNI